jgi:hypothetical protein
MEKLIKVDRVCSIKEAEKLTGMGVETIGVSLHANPLFPDGRNLNLQEIKAIRGSLVNAKLAIEVGKDFNVPALQDLRNEIEFEFLQTSEIPPIDVRQAAQSLGIGIIYSGIEASYEDDPSWILSRFADTPELNASFFQIDLLGDMEDSWNFFKTQSPDFPDELQISDIQDIGEESPIIVSIDFNAGNLGEVIQELSSCKGVFFTLADSSQRDDLHYFGFEKVCEILTKLKLNDSLPD